MWKLVNTEKEHCESYLFVGKEFVVGRKNCSLVIGCDLTVSRTHAALHVRHPEENLEVPSKSSSLYINDLASKFGTFKNDVKVTSEVELDENDVVRFGLFSTFRVERIPLVATGSCLNASIKEEMTKIIHILGGHFIPEWHPLCTHLIMPEVLLTVKALCSLSSAKPIVTPEYFKQLNESIQSSTFLAPNKFIPSNGEALIQGDKISFDVNIKRKKLFENRTFYFIDYQQLNQLHLCIELAGGYVSMITSQNVNSEIMLQDYCCVLEPSRIEPDHHIEYMLPHIRFILQKKNLRLIYESEISLAIAYCSTKAFCNPNLVIGAMETPMYSTMQNKLCETSVNESEKERAVPHEETDIFPQIPGAYSVVPVICLERCDAIWKKYQKVPHEETDIFPQITGAYSVVPVICLERCDAIWKKYQKKVPNFIREELNCTITSAEDRESV